MIHLRVHSHYSLLTALPKIDKLVKTAATNGMNALAITDNSNMYGAIEFVKECQKKKIKPIIGCELKIKTNSIDNPVVLIAKTYDGYKNLMQLVTIANTKNIHNTHPYLIMEDFLLPSNGTHKKLYEDIICLSGGPWGEISEHLKVNDIVKAKSVYDSFYKLFAEDYYLEITPHTYMDYGKEIRENTIGFARSVNAKLVATQNN